MTERKQVVIEYITKNLPNHLDPQNNDYVMIYELAEEVAKVFADRYSFAQFELIIWVTEVTEVYQRGLGI